jgi:hypothetical protein
MVLKHALDSISYDPRYSDTERRRKVFDGQIFMFSPTPASLEFAAFARGMVEDAFNGLDPRYAQYEMPVEDYVAIVAPLKPRFIHHPRTRGLIAAVLADIGCDLDETYLDVPRLRTVTSDGYLTAGVGYPFPPHRDTWFSAPMAQLNFWMPLYDLTDDSTMAFHPAYWDQPVRNSSRVYNYYEWIANGRANAAKHIKQDTRKQPQLEQEVALQPQSLVDLPPGGFVLFSAAQLHSTVPNTSGRTRYSVDFRTVHIEDLRQSQGAANLDSECSGTALRDFLRGTDGADLPADVIDLYDDGTGAEYGQLIYTPPADPTH